MAAHALSSLMFFIMALGITSSRALDIAVTNSAQATKGGAIFDQQIGRGGAVNIITIASKFIWTAFHQQNPTDRKKVQKISLIVESMNGVAYTSNDEIHLSAEYVGNYNGDVKTEIKGVLYHEVVHVWQWNGNGNAPGGLIEGIADYVRLSAGLAPSHWVKAGGGDRWDQGYDVTAYFLQYCESVSSGFVANMNAKLKDGWRLQFFNDITGKSVDELWKDYKAKYASSP